MRGLSIGSPAWLRLSPWWTREAYFKQWEPRGVIVSYIRLYTCLYFRTRGNQWSLALWISLVNRCSPLQTKELFLRQIGPVPWQGRAVRERRWEVWARCSALPRQPMARTAGSLLERKDAFCWVCCTAELWWLVWLLALCPLFKWNAE